jgi:hypothetical protein
MPSESPDANFVFNVVFTPGTFRFLQLFTRSLIAQSDARIRLVANGCPPAEVQLMHNFAGEYEGRTEMFELSNTKMVPHGVALDEIYAAHDDGSSFCFVDSDVKAKLPFMECFVDALTRVDVVTSCTVAWSSDSILAPGIPDLVGRHAVGHDGFVYGSSYLAIYGRAVVEHVRAAWGVTFRPYSYDTLAPPVQRRLVEMGRQFRLYDTAKVLNILLQGEGFGLSHVDNPALVHIGGISQYLSDPSILGRDPESLATDDASVPWFAASGTGRQRWDFARWAAATLRSIVDGEAAPGLPDDPAQRLRATEVQRELLDLAGH